MRTFNPTRTIMLLIVFLIFGSAAFSQKATTGQVTDSTGQALSGVSILVKGTKKGTNSDQQGNFSISTADDATLVFSYVGFASKEIKATGSILKVQLVPTFELNAVVVTALGIKRQEKSLGYATQKVGGEALQTVKGVDIGTSLTGKVAGFVVKNSTEFNAKPTLEMRGETPLLVIDGVPYGNMTLRDIPTDDIESIDMLKGPTAAALYGSRGSGGAVMVSLKKGKGKGLKVDINSNTMVATGFLAIPKVQTSYGHGSDGQIADDYVWGPKLDIGTTALQWNPITKQEEDMPLVSSGKNNLKNFLQTGVIANNNISVTQSGENGYFRAGLNHIYNKGQFPNAKLNIINYTMSGELKAGDKFSLESHMGYTHQTAPQIWGSGYDAQGYIYQILMWTGADYDIRQYKDYWVKPNVQQNWLYKTWYDNPYLIANEKLDGIDQNKLNASLLANYKFNKNLKLMLRSGYDYYKNEETVQNPASINSTRGGNSGQRPDGGKYQFGWSYSAKGMYGMNQMWGYSTNNDLILTYNKTVGKLGLDALAGGSIFYYVDREFGSRTRNGLAIPGFYSLANAVASTTAGVDALINNYATWKKQVNSAYGKLSASWNNMAFVDVTARNDWSSTLQASQRSYFYPSVASSLVLSQFIHMPREISMLKIRGSWTKDKGIPDIYDNNRNYSRSTSWGYPSSSYPSNLLPLDLIPSATRTWEFGAAAYLFNKRLHIDVAYFDRLKQGRQISDQDISSSSGFSITTININEDIVRRGLEITLDGTIIKHRKFEWYSMINYSFNHQYYASIDSIYSPDNLWTKKGARIDTYAKNLWLRDGQGNIIHEGGYPVQSDYSSKMGYGDPNFSFGFMNSFTYGDLLLSISIDGRIGGLMYNRVWDKMFDTGANPETDNQYRYDQVVKGLNNYVGKGVKVVSGSAEYDKYGRITSDSRKYAANDEQVGYQSYAQWLSGGGGEHGIMSESFFKVREISVGYRIPKKLFGNSGIKSASVSLTAQNVFLWTKFKFSDPDLDTENLNSPAQRMLGLNVRVGF